MKKLFLLLLLVPSLAFAYPVDRRIEGIEAYLLGVDQPWDDPHTQPHLHFDDKTFHDLHFQYEHIRRDVYQMVVRYNSCFNSRFIINSILGQPKTSDYNKSIGEYLFWIPAHPLPSIANKSNRNDHAEANIAGAYATFDSFLGNTIACENNLKRITDCMKAQITKRTPIATIAQICK